MTKGTTSTTASRAATPTVGSRSISATGALYYIGPGEDYEAGTTSYALTVRASDGSLHSRGEP